MGFLVRRIVAPVVYTEGNGSRIASLYGAHTHFNVHT